MVIRNFGPFDYDWIINSPWLWFNALSLTFSRCLDHWLQFHPKKDMIVHNSYSHFFIFWQVFLFWSLIIKMGHVCIFCSSTHLIRTMSITRTISCTSYILYLAEMYLGIWLMVATWDCFPVSFLVLVSVFQLKVLSWGFSSGAFIILIDMTSIDL